MTLVFIVEFGANQFSVPELSGNGTDMLIFVIFKVIGNIYKGLNFVFPRRFSTPSVSRDFQMCFMSLQFDMFFFLLLVWQFIFLLYFEQAN